MRKLILCLLLFVMLSSVKAQPGWNLQFSSDTVSGFYYVGFPDISKGYALRAGQVFKTSNLGLSWQIYTFPRALFYTAYFLNKDTAYSVGSTGGTLIRTYSGGTAWDSLYEFPADIVSLKFFDVNTGFAGSYQGKVYKTTNKGVSWSMVLQVIEDLDTRIESFYFPNSSTGLACASTYISAGPFSSYSTRIYKTTDGGANWATNYLLNGIYITEMKFADENTGYGSTLFSGVVKTTNGGVNWSQVYTSGQINCIEVLSASRVYIPGAVTTNGGATWQTQSLPESSFFLRSICFVNINTGFIVGGRIPNDGSTAKILKTTDGGVIAVQQISSVVPDKYSLKQNYPNPFNPTTRINYELRNTNYVSLKVFDLLGKEVGTLVNEKQNAGSYAVDFNSAEFNLPSGIYFYTLNAGEFKETRKMILIK
ncbi:MAG: T9SS type A sorting domain-containing protein [Bacteroidetes bacterium]|nr:T9SS type A sorting domain-containing protein [Bacteroidota bacterium]